MNNKPLIIIAGPTAAGKTELSILLANKINGAVISADSMQAYKYMDIGSAKIMPHEMQGIKHYGIDIIEPTSDYNVVSFQKMAKEAIDDIYNNNKIPIIVGGTGFYIQSVLYDINFEDNEKSDDYRLYLENIANEKGANYLHDMLKEVDNESAISIHPNNVKRVIRALEYYKQTGNKISEHNEIEKAKESPYNSCFFVITDDRDKLYSRIDKRVDLMVENGLIEEVKNLKAMGLNRDNVSMQGLGYKEILDYLDGALSIDEAIDIIKRDTRRFAKRQETWFRREPEAIWINRSQEDNNTIKMLENILNNIKSKGII